MAPSGKKPRNLGKAIHDRFAPLGGVDLPTPVREPVKPSNEVETLYRNAELDPDRREVAADCDALPDDEGLN